MDNNKTAKEKFIYANILRKTQIYTWYSQTQTSISKEYLSMWKYKIKRDSFSECEDYNVKNSSNILEIKIYKNQYAQKKNPWHHGMIQLKCSHHKRPRLQSTAT